MHTSGKVFSSDAAVIASLKRNQLVNIDNSYNNEWDLLAELAQNSVDAIGLRGESQNNVIDITFDVDNKKIVFKDNGCGFTLDGSPNSLLGNPTLLDVNVTTKSGDSSQIGEKGVGLKYVIFNSDLVTIKTCDGEKSSSVKLEGFSSWKVAESVEFPEWTSEPLNQINQGTEITLEQLDSKFDKLFQLTKDQLLFVLRTKTAIGRTNLHWVDDSPQIKVQLEFVKNGQREFVEVKSEFWSVSENHPNVLDYDSDYLTWLKKADRTDQQKIKKLRNQVILRRGEVTLDESQRKIRYFIVFLPKREVFETTSINSELCTKEQFDSTEWQENFGFATFQSGIEISSKGMPTGIKIPEPTTGYAGYWKNIYMLFEDDSLVFDIGRKAVDGRSTRKIKEIAKKQFNELLKTITKYISGTSSGFSQHFNKVKVFNEINQLDDLNSMNSTFQKSPSSQEASVAAIFYELIGAKVLNGISPIISGYKETYDLYANVSNSDNELIPAIIEFKSKLSNLLPDLAKQIKYTSDIDCIVCYDVTDDDISKFEDAGFSVEILEHPEDEFPCATHKVSLPRAKDYWVIDIKRFV